MAEPSQIFAPLAQSPVFLGRIAFLLVMTAPVVIAAAHAAKPIPNDRAVALAVAVAADPVRYAAVFAVHVSANVNVVLGGALIGSGLTLDTPATDGALFAAVSVIWPTVAGVL